MIFSRNVKLVCSALTSHADNTQLFVKTAAEWESRQPRFHPGHRVNIAQTSALTSLAVRLLTSLPLNTVHRATGRLCYDHGVNGHTRAVSQRAATYSTTVLPEVRSAGSLSAFSRSFPRATWVRVVVRVQYVRPLVCR